MFLGMMLGGCGLVSQKAGIEIMSYPTAKVFIDGKEAGMTPYKNTSLVPKDTEIKLIASGLEWNRKIRLENGVTTVIDWEFGKSERESGGYILGMEKTGDKNRAGLMISTSPDEAAIMVEGEIRGKSPIKLEDIGEGDKQVTISLPGHKTINVFPKGIRNYLLVLEARLAEEITTTIEAETELAKPEPEMEEEMVLIKETETGWLRVRSQPGNSGEEIAKVKPKEKYRLIEEKEGWYKIELPNKNEGWVSAKYAEKYGQGQ